jgi:hypothetical protein
LCLPRFRCCSSSCAAGSCGPIRLAQGLPSLPARASCSIKPYSSSCVSLPPISFHQTQSSPLSNLHHACPVLAAAAPAALLAAAGPSGWLKLYQASLPGPHSWQLLHSSSPGSLAGPITAVAFNPTGDTLAAAGPAAQVLGTDATAVAAAGGQPGAVSLYSVSSSSRSAAGGLGQQLRLWHQWCVRSLPVSLAVLPSSGVQLMTGRELGAREVRAVVVLFVSGGAVCHTFAVRHLRWHAPHKLNADLRRDMRQP